MLQNFLTCLIPSVPTGARTKKQHGYNLRFTRMFGHSCAGRSR